MGSHLLRVEYTGLALGKLEAYAYLLDFDDRVSERFSTAAFGLRVEGDQGLTPNATLTYAGEFAHQCDYAENSNDIDVNYTLGEVGVSYNLGWQLQTVALNVGYEVLEGDGRHPQGVLGGSASVQASTPWFLSPRSCPG